MYVGGSGPGNYFRIQDAVDNSSDGDTIYVYKGIYSDYFIESDTCVNISKKIKLIGEEKHNTIINGIPGLRSVVNIKSNNVDISGFTIKNNESGIAAVLIDRLLELKKYMA